MIAAGIIMFSVFGGFVFADSAMIRSIGFGLAFGVLADAFVVRMLLMPALMHLLGKRPGGCRSGSTGSCPTSTSRAPPSGVATRTSTRSRRESHGRRRPEPTA